MALDLRTLLAAILGVVLGAVLVAYPDAVVRAQTAGRIPGQRDGEFGSDSPISERWRRLVQALGVVSFAGGLYFAWTLV